MKNHDIEQAQSYMDEYLHDLKTIVNIDSGTYTKSGVDRVGAYLQNRFQTLGFSTYFDKQEQYGDHLIATHTGQSPHGPHIVFIGHIDTVLPDGEAERRPFTIKQDNGMRVATGPGVLDMKSGVLIGMYALRLLIESQKAHYSNVTFICNSDEEIGSPSSRPLIQKLAPSCRCCPGLRTWSRRGNHRLFPQRLRAISRRGPRHIRTRGR